MGVTNLPFVGSKRGLTMQEEPEINIEEIMSAIRQKIVSERASTPHSPSISLRSTGKRLPAQYYEHLYQAGISYNQIDVDLLVTPNRIPFIGPLLQWVRTKLHEVILFYVNRLAANQIQVNTQLLQALNVLGEQLEKEARE